MAYLDDEHLEIVFDLIYKRYARREEVPYYQDERSGMEKLKGVLQGVRMDEFYPDFFDKTAYLFTQINEGHFFSNGNKRLALVITATFVGLNEFQFQNFSKEKYKDYLSHLFSGYSDWQDFDEFYPEEFGLYNLSIIVADNKKYVQSFDELKNGVKEFLSFSVMK